MGKRRKGNIRITGVLLITIMGMFYAVSVWANNGDCAIEQISLNMPDVRIYYRSESPEKSYEAYLGGEVLNYDSTSKFSDLGEGVDYYLMLDVSASIPDSQFENIKSGLVDFISSKGEKDKCILLTFGNESSVVLDGSETWETAAKIVQALNNDDMETVLFQSVVQAAEMIDKAAQTEEKRRVIITITDGEDCVTGQATSAEALSNLNHKGIPLYAVAVDVGKEEYINSFGEFARNTGGTLSIFNSGICLDLLNQIRNTVQNTYVAFFHSDTNVASNEREDLTVKFLEHQVRDTKEVIPDRWTPDSEAPAVTVWQKQGNNEIQLTFSEKLLNADSPSNYKVEQNGAALPVDSVFYSEEEMPCVVLTFQEPLYTGEYSIRFSGITDCSMERNKISAMEEFHLDGVEPEKEKFPWQWVFLGFFALILIAAVSVAVAIYKKIRKNKGVIYVDGKAIFASNVDVKQHVSTVSLPQKTVTLLIRDQINGQCKMQVTINGSVMVGRSNECEVYFDDPKMSRQHFALETDGEEVYITDLESRNGTLVNGVPLKTRRKLMPDDEIAAGNIQARIVW